MIIVIIWQVASDPLLTRIVMDGVRESKGTLPPEQLNLLINDVRNLVAGNVFRHQIDPVLQTAADRYIGMIHIGNTATAARNSDPGRVMRLRMCCR